MAEVTQTARTLEVVSGSVRTTFYNVTIANAGDTLTTNKKNIVFCSASAPVQALPDSYGVITFVGGSGPNIKVMVIWQ